ncbi:hypothetical protein [Winogradskyella vincentii]|uniref:Uncharacterized protein n=1 Tax=Winogradskyella vincentii TaxID=2877122 RepID=A0ABS7XZQ1_9FLAO|nr:hypothetical protein [Winogradskyella vincentii]MCA0152826.1 hypothetical protein [Winogradskyella vincentii]
MELLNYFLVFLGIQIILVAYFLFTRQRIKSEFKVDNKSNRSFSLNSARNRKMCNKPNSYCSTMNMKEELKRNRRQLRRHIMTLNYLTKLESSKTDLKNITPVVDMANIKQKLNREVIRNAKLVKHYESMVA